MGGGAEEGSKEKGSKEEASREEGLQLIPIDHGFCLPERPTLACFEWRSWPQA